MKNRKHKFLIFVVSFMMVTTAWAGAFTAYAEENTEAEGTAETVENGEAAIETEEEAVTEETEEAVPEETEVAAPEEAAEEAAVEAQATAAPAAVTNLRAVAGKGRVVLRWTAVPDADGYIINRTGGSVAKTGLDTSGNAKDFFTKTGNQCEWRNQYDVNIGEVYTYSVVAYKNVIEETEGDVSGSEVKGEAVQEEEVQAAAESRVQSAAVSTTGECVRPMYIRVTFKQKKTLKAHDSSKKKYTIKKGQTMITDGYSSGAYMFKVDGHPYRVNRARCKNAKAYYTTKMEYGRESAEEFVNNCGLSSSTNRFMWVSFYTQHIYIMKKVGSRWTVEKDWECSTGMASAPSPTGVKAINGFRPKSRHGLAYWSGYSGKNAFHGKRGSWKLGKPKSHGCIRNLNVNAKWIYKNVKKGTRVYNY